MPLFKFRITIYFDMIFTSMLPKTFTIAIGGEKEPLAAFEKLNAQIAEMCNGNMVSFITTKNKCLMFDRTGIRKITITPLTKTKGTTYTSTN